MPNATTTRPRYMGWRVKRYGPPTTSARLASEVGSTSVPAWRNRKKAQAARPQPAKKIAMPTVSWCGGQAIRGQPSAQLSPAVTARKIIVQIGGGNFSIGVALPCRQPHDQPDRRHAGQRGEAGPHTGQGPIAGRRQLAGADVEEETGEQGDREAEGPL